VSEARAVIVGSLGSSINATGKIIESDFSLILGISNGEIKRFSCLRTASPSPEPRENSYSPRLPTSYRNQIRFSDSSM
jgi:hypothetical protein